MTVGCVIPAAGRGERLGGSGPKALRLLAGQSLLERSVRALAAVPDVAHIVVAAPPEHLDEVTELLAGLDVAAGTSAVPGGSSRTESVGNAVRALPADTTIVLVHDAARPLVPRDVVERVIGTCRTGAVAVIPTIPVTDTIKRVTPDGRVAETVDRDQLAAVQTPQGFDRQALTAVLAATGGTATDDAGLMERAGHPVVTVPGDPRSLKITRPLDLAIAEMLLSRESPDA